MSSPHEFPSPWLDFAGLAPADLPTIPEPSFPPPHQRYRALALLPPSAVRVVILGQDPYHGDGQAHGLAFSVPTGVRLPPSLRNIYKELAADLGAPPAPHGDLSSWVEQGVLLLNTALSVAPGLPGSHAEHWQQLTAQIIAALGASEESRAFILWGAHAQRIAAGKIGAQHLVIESAHPSPLSARRGFFGSKPFSRVNAWLLSRGELPVTWCP